MGNQGKQKKVYKQLKKKTGEQEKGGREKEINANIVMLGNILNV